MSSTDRDVLYVDRGLASNVKKIHGINPVLLIEKILREIILDSLYWKKDCFNLNCLTILDQIVDIKLIGTYSNSNKTRPTKFICLLLKLLQLQPNKEIINYLLIQKDFKYLTALAALYIRITYDSIDIYTLLEPLLNDRRKLIIIDGKSTKLDEFKSTTITSITYMDEFIDNLLNNSKFIDLMLPRLLPRLQLEDQDVIEPRESELQSEFEDNLSDFE
ncbi:hypothetical protein B5S28_g4925 [[Candida] boidinii]|nr:hypothetical protein B5S28_g4925 [[Candida] boidinii]OWB62132.1 hypothetical protein B5S29_g3051 [[Candida] boidinii]OWB70643.1 hypothetical protein B5S31_g322 [[Candida] boidinii]